MKGGCVHIIGCQEGAPLWQGCPGNVGCLPLDACLTDHWMLPCLLRFMLPRMPGQEPCKHCHCFLWGLVHCIALVMLLGS